MPEEALTQSAPSQSEAPSGGSSVHEHSLATPSSDRGSEASSSSQTNGQSGDGSVGKQKPKELSRYERTKRAKAQFNQERAAFQKQQAEFAEQRRAFEESQKPKRDYTIADLQKYRGQWEDEGRTDLVQAADKEIAQIKAEEAEKEKASKRTVDFPVMGTPQHKAQWEAAEAELAQADSQFMRSGTPLDTKLREIMGGPDGNIYRQHPRGIVAAYHRAKMELLEGENSQLKQELQRYQGLTSVGGGVPGRVGSGARVESLSDFSRLSSKDMRKHLLNGAKRGDTPWF